MKVAQAKLKEIGPDDMNMEEYKVKSWPSIHKALNLNSLGNLTVLWGHRRICSLSLPPTPPKNLDK